MTLTQYCQPGAEYKVTRCEAMGVAVGFGVTAGEVDGWVDPEVPRVDGIVGELVGVAEFVGCPAQEIATKDIIDITANTTIIVYRIQ